ncbi:MAG: 2-oxo-4-hydroxy-4-carboxy-5-ureidoimidazoline decarboxylase, partial [Oceanospirillaceae bacterium]
FIMAVKGSNKQQIIAAFEKRLLNDNETEFKQAVLEINKIALSRLNQL